MSVLGLTCSLIVTYIRSKFELLFHFISALHWFNIVFYFSLKFFFEILKINLKVY